MNQLLLMLVLLLLVLLHERRLRSDPLTPLQRSPLLRLPSLSLAERLLAFVLCLVASVTK